MSTPQDKCDTAGNLINIKVKYLDSHIEHFTMNCNALGSDLYQKISIRMQLIESSFFGLQYISLESDLCWLDLRKSIKKQTDFNNEFSYEFCIKFYSPDPNLLHDHLTKKLFVLQIQKDITNGELICSESTKVLLGGIFLQLQYLESTNLQLEDAERFLINLFNDQCLSPDFIDQCLKFHKTLQCQTVEETHFDLLEVVRKIDFYGMKLHPAKDNEGLSLNLAVYHMGIVIFQKYTKINTFNWSKIRKLSFKRKRFLIKLHPEEYLELFVLWVVQGFYKDTLEFYFESRNSCKNFWKKCIEHHAFFRTHSNASCVSLTKSKTKHRFRRSFSGSRFRYIGLTQFELDQLHKETYQNDNLFQRSESACRLISSNPSFLNLSRRNSENKYKSNHSLSIPIKPFINDSFHVNKDEREISQNHIFMKENQSHWERRVSVENKIKNHYIHSLNPISKALTTNCIGTADSLCSNEHENLFDDTGNRSVKYIISASTSDETVPFSLTDVPEPVSDKDNPDNFSYYNDYNSNCDEYAFVPNLLAQISLFECSKLNVSISIHPADIPDSSKKSINFTSDTISPQTVLKCMEKEFLFNEFTYLKELQILIKVINNYLNNPGKSNEMMKSIFVKINQMKTATSMLIGKLEKLIQVNTQSLTTSCEHVHQFLVIISEYGRQIQENLRCYIQEIKDFISALMQSDFSQNFCDSTHPENDRENEKNLLRLFITPIIQQRAHLSCLSIFILFIPSDDEEKLVCQESISKIQDILRTAEGIEEFAHIGLMISLIRGLYTHQDIEFDKIIKSHPIRVGWLQKLSNRGASSRLFILLPDQLVCAKKMLPFNFSIEYRWFLTGIRVGTISDMTKTTNGYDPSLSLFDSITIMLLDPGASDPKYSSVVLLADTNQSRSKWIEEIKKLTSASSNAKLVSKNCSQEINSKPSCTKEMKFWTEKCRLIDICWHERLSMSKVEMGFLFKFSLSAYLLRKCKSSNSWQRLWVVLTDCHLFFYQSHLNEQAITSLCLVGFQISEPISQDSISKLWVIKLEKESKTCFLRTENQYFYHRWRTAISCCTFSNT